jgi:serine/threonine-protein kinase
MGKVYFGEQTRMKRPCAVKVLSPRFGSGGDSDEFVRRFLLEASVAAKLTHPNVVTIFDYGETADGRCFIAMEYLEGRSLSDELKRSGRLVPERAVHIAKQVCRALREAHAIGVVHRDVKPGNVFLIRRDDDDDFVKVLDFGLVKEVHVAEAAEHTKVDQIMGSPRYMAPEQVQGQTVDARTDVYSLGATLYAMLAGRPPFEKTSELATMMAQVSDAPPRIASVAPEAALPPGLEALVMKCLAKSPDQRYSSMEELITALRLGAGGTVGLSDSGQHGTARLVPPTMSVSPGQTASQTAMPFVVGAALLVGVAVGVALLSQPEAPAPTASNVVVPPAPTQPPPPVPKPSATLHVETDPPGAKVKEEGETMCEATPCDIVYVGEAQDSGLEHLLVLMKPDFKLERKLASVAASPLTVKLTKAH